MHTITTTDELAAACRSLAAGAFVTVDTEFMREATYYPILCLVQIAGEGEEHLVDPLAKGIDLTPFMELMGNKAVTKVFHAARQDVEIVYAKSGLIPEPLFDTQIAAMVCGFGESVSFSNLVKKIVGADVDKSSQFTDWSRRPLSAKQLTYALADVTHLRPVYRHLEQEVGKSGRAHWLAEELASLTSPETYRMHPDDAWQRLKLRVKSKKALGVLMEVAAWRERTAQALDVPRGRVLKDEAIYDIANQMPQTGEQLASLRTLHDGFSRSQRGQEILQAVKLGLDRPARSLPPLERGTPVPAEAAAVLDLLRVLLKARSAEHGVAPKLIATTEDLEQIALEAEADVPALHGWRRELFGEDALRLKRGELGLSVRNGGVVTVAG
jgi:ribonuclease D